MIFFGLRHRAHSADTNISKKLKALGWGQYVSLKCYVPLFQRKDKYFLDSSDKVSYFFEGGAVDENGELLVEPKIALNKMGHALHWLNPIFKKYTFCEKVKETCFQLGLVDPVVVQSMYIFKNPGVGSEGMNLVATSILVF